MNTRTCPALVLRLLVNAVADSCVRPVHDACHTQLPLKLLLSLAMHKCRGKAFAVINLGAKEACMGLAFIWLSRAKWLLVS